MSAKRRKSFQNKRSLTNVKQMISECVRETMSATRSLGAQQSQNMDQLVTSISNDSAITNAFREEVKDVLTERVKKDPDFDEKKYPSSSRAFK
jgi:hypothetical protein